MRGTRLVIADRHPIVLQGLASVFAAQRDFEIVASCRDGASCLEAIRNLIPDVALVDDSLLDLTASEILTIANAENLSTRLVFFAASVEGGLAAAIAAGTCGAISKHASAETLLQSLRLVAKGISLLPDPAPNLAPAGKQEDGLNAVLAVLTEREREIMRLVAEGLSNKAIARRLKVSQGTIKVHLHNTFQKLEINNRTELAALAISRRFGGFGILAALTLVTLDDIQAADRIASNDAPINPGTTSESAGCIANAALGAPTAIGKFADTDFSNTANKFTVLSSPRPNSGGYGTFMMTAAGALTSTLDKADSAVQALDIGDTPTDIFAVPAADGTRQRVTVTIPGSPDADCNDFDYRDLGRREISDPRFDLGGDAIAGSGDEFQIASVGAGRDIVHDTGKDYPLLTESDTVKDNDGNDVLYGESRTVNSDAGADTVVGGFGGGRLKSCNGDDTFVYLAGANSGSAEFETIDDFKSGSDRINLAAFGALVFLALSPTATTVPPHTVAWRHDSANNQTIVYVNQTDKALDIGDAALLEIHLPGAASIRDSDFVHEPAKATVAVTGETIDPGLAAIVAGDVLTTSGAKASVEATGSETACVTDCIRTSLYETGSAQSASSGKAPEHATEDGGDDAVTLASGYSVELPRDNATGLVEDHFTFDHEPIHARTIATTTSDAAVALVEGTIDSGGLVVATAIEALQHAENDTTHASAANQDQSQRDLHAALEDGSVAVEQRADHGASQGNGSEQSQRDSHVAPEEGFSVAEQDAEHATQASAANHGQSQASANLSNNSYSESDLHAAREDRPARADTRQEEMAAATVLGDSLQFKNEMAASKHSDTVDLAEVDRSPAWTAHGRHAAGHDGPGADVEPAWLSVAEQNADHAAGARHHAMHDLIV